MLVLLLKLHIEIDFNKLRIEFNAITAMQILYSTQILVA